MIIAGKLDKTSFKLQKTACRLLINTCLI